MQPARRSGNRTPSTPERCPCRRSGVRRRFWAVGQLPTRQKELGSNGRGTEIDAGWEEVEGGCGLAGACAPRPAAIASTVEPIENWQSCESTRSSWFPTAGGVRPMEHRSSYELRRGLADVLSPPCGGLSPRLATGARVLTPGSRALRTKAKSETACPSQSTLFQGIGRGTPFTWTPRVWERFLVSEIRRMTQPGATASAAVSSAGRSA